MSKLEEKLIKLGYEPPINYMFHTYFTKFIDDSWILTIETDREATKVRDGYIDLGKEYIYSQKQMDELQQAFNLLQKDLALLKEVLENE